MPIFTNNRNKVGKHATMSAQCWCLLTGENISWLHEPWASEELISKSVISHNMTSLSLPVCLLLNSFRNHRTKKPQSFSLKKLGWMCTPCYRPYKSPVSVHMETLLQRTVFAPHFNAILNVAVFVPRSQTSVLFLLLISSQSPVFFFFFILV